MQNLTWGEGCPVPSKEILGVLGHSMGQADGRSPIAARGVICEKLPASLDAKSDLVWGDGCAFPRKYWGQWITA